MSNGDSSVSGSLASSQQWTCDGFPDGMQERDGKNPVDLIDGCFGSFASYGSRMNEVYRNGEHILFDNSYDI